MFKIRVLLVFILSMYLLGCKSTATVAEINSLKEVVADKNFEFTANSAIPLSFGNTRGIENLLPIGSNTGFINLIGSPNFLKISNDILDIDMPFYGVRNLGGTYNTRDVGFKFKSKIETVKTTFNSKKKNYILRYNVNNKQENLRITLTLFANNTCNLNIISSHRNTINYKGNWKRK